MQLVEPLPWQRQSEEVTEMQNEIEGAAFMALMAQTQGGDF